MPRKPTARRDLLANAHASEINWTCAAPLLKGKQRGQTPFVYFVGEGDDGPVKIGTATDPISRLRGLQTGNPRRLRIERLVYGNITVERLIQAYLCEFVIGGKRQTTEFKATHAKGTEWFVAEARERLLYAADAILAAQRSWKDPIEGVRQALDALGYEIRETEPLMLLARTAGYVRVRI